MKRTKVIAGLAALVLALPLAAMARDGGGRPGPQSGGGPNRSQSSSDHSGPLTPKCFSNSGRR